MNKKKLYYFSNSSKTNDESFYLLSQKNLEKVKNIDLQILDIHWEAKELLDELIECGDFSEEQCRLNYHFSSLPQLYDIEKIANYDFVPNELRGKYYALIREKQNILKGNFLGDTIKHLITFATLFFSAFWIMKIIQFITNLNFYFLKFERDWFLFFVICIAIFLIPKILFAIIIDCENEGEKKAVSGMIWNIFSRISLPIIIAIWFL